MGGSPYRWRGAENLVKAYPFTFGYPFVFDKQELYPLFALCNYSIIAYKQKIPTPKRGFSVGNWRFSIKKGGKRCRKSFYLLLYAFLKGFYYEKIYFGNFCFFTALHFSLLMYSHRAERIKSVYHLHGNRRFFPAFADRLLQSYKKEECMVSAFVLIGIYRKLRIPVPVSFGYAQ